MDKMIAYCGLVCTDCKAYLATQNNDNKMRAEVAAEWSKLFNVEIKPESINCDGCKSIEGTLFGHCQTCEIRQCGMNKKLETCAHCKAYACKKLDGLFNVMPHAKEKLDDIKHSLS